MPKKEDTDKRKSTLAPLDEKNQDAVEAIGRIIHSASIYGIDHRASRDAMSSAFEKVKTATDSSKKINFTIRDKRLVVNGKAPASNTAFINQLLQKMQSKDITAFSIVKGMNEDEFRKLLSLLVSRTGKKFDEELKEQNLSHVKSDKIVYKEMTEGEEQSQRERETRKGEGIRLGGLDKVAKEWLAGKGEGYGDASDGPESGSQHSPGVEQIVAFLKGNVSSDNPALQENLERVAEDSDILANLIMESAAIRQSQTDIGSGESVADLVLGCLRRTYEGLKETPKAKTQQGKIELKKSLLLLEKNIIDKLHRITSENDPGMDARISEAIQEMGEDFELDYIATEYVQQRAAMARNEKKIADYIKQQDGKSLEKRLLNAGMAPESWHRLNAKGDNKAVPQPEGASGGESIPGGFGALAVVLAKFDELMSSTTPNAAEVSEFMDEIDRHVEDVEERTAQSIDEFANDIKREIQENDIKEKKLRNRRENFTLFVARLAELGQELLQPLTVVSCSINMAVSGYTGELTDEQKDLLSLAHSSSKRLDRLINRLIEMVGYPKDLKPESVGDDADEEE